MHPIGGDLLASLTSTFDRKLKSLLSATTVEAVTDATTATETKSSDMIQEPSKPPQEKETAESDGEDKSSPVSAREDAEMSKSRLLEASAITSVERKSVQPAVTFTPTSTALFRDPSLHRRKSAPVDQQGQKHVC